MGIDVSLRRIVRKGTSRRNWTETELAIVPDVDYAFSAALEHIWDSGLAPMLDRLDPVGDLTITSDEAGQLIAELTTLLGRLDDAKQRAIVASISELANRCLLEKDLELRFLGD